MSSKKHIHSVWSKIQDLNLWYLLAAVVVSGLVCVFALRQNNLTMIKLRNQVFVADKANGDVETALRNLRSYIYAHMHTNLDSGNSIRPPIQLKYRYDRLVTAEKDRVSSINAKVYNDAQQYCEQFISHQVFGGAHISCVQDYINTHGVKEQSIPDSIYKFDFVSPAWTPDLAGWSLVVTILLVLLFIVRLGLEIWVKHDLG